MTSTLSLQSLGSSNQRLRTPLPMLMLEPNNFPTTFLAYRPKEFVCCR